jgi:adenylate cyclase
MWTLTIRSPNSKPIEFQLKTEKNTIGRRRTNDVVISDEAASRQHAQIYLDPKTNSVTIRDLDSKNGTFINRRRLSSKHDIKLSPSDIVRIGDHELLLSVAESDNEVSSVETMGFQPFSRELLLESFDNHAVLIYEVIQKLNNVLDVDVALREVCDLLSVTLGADKCQVILADDFERMSELGFPESIADFVIQKRTAILLPSPEDQSEILLSDSARLLKAHTLLCVPVVSGQETIALIYMYKTRTNTRHFDDQDMQLAVAVGHLAALTIERVSLMGRVREEQRVRQLLQRFVAPREAEHLLRSYLETGSLPELSELECTVLFADIAGSSRMAEKMGTKRFGELLNRYYQDVTDVIFEHGGLLDKYLGDGFMAVFGMTGLQKNPEERAVSAAIEILKLLEARYQKMENHIDVGIGINSGPVIAGYISTRERVELSVLGDAVNIASGLESMARPNRILIGPKTSSAISKRFSLKNLGEVSIKERSSPIEVHEVLS